jgi:hypothetical protein
MGKSLSEIAQQLINNDKKIQLIYAFNGTGKTRLSIEFKNLISDINENEQILELAKSKILYYNAFTEDLFYWDNGLDGDVEPKLKIQPNTFTRWVLQEQGQDRNIIDNFQRYTNEKLTPHFSPDFSEGTFSFERGNNQQESNIKISKGEESNFIWSMFYSLIKQVIDVLNVAEPIERETNQFDQLEYVFIDDPVSSLDENHLIELAVDLAQLIKSSKSSALKFIITTHNTLFYNVIHNELNKKTCYILESQEHGTFELKDKEGDSNKSFSYHLFLKHTLEDAIKQNNIQKYHFTLLRNLYEKTANFLGYPKWSELLPTDKQSYLNRIIQFTTHSTLSNEVVAMPTEPEKKIIKLLLGHLVGKYNFWQEAPNERL